MDSCLRSFFFGPSNPGHFFKRCAKVFTLRDKVLKSISFWAEAVLKLGSHSLSLEPSDFENVSLMDQLAVKLFQERQRFVDHA